MEVGNAARRVVHLLTPCFLVYYLLPDEIFAIDKRFGLVLVVVFALLVDGLRAIRGWEVIGARPYEKRRISSATWAGLGLMLAFMYFPQHFVVPVVFGMAWIDPLMGEVRKRKRVDPLVVGIPVYTVIFAVIHIVLFPQFTVLTAAEWALVAALSATLIEQYGPLWLDDDLSMIIVPLLLLYPIGMAFG
jgi:hypothetical protein